MDPELVKEMVNRGMLKPEEAQQYLSPAPAPSPIPEPPTGALDTAIGLGKAAGTGMIKGTIGGTLGLAGDLEKLGRWGYGAATGTEPGKTVLPESADIYKKIAFALHDPQTAAERYTEAGAEGATALVNPLGFAGKAKLLTKGGAALGGLMGVAGEAGREALPENSVPAGVAASLAPQAAKLLLSSPALTLKAIAMVLPPGPLKMLFNRPIWTGTIKRMVDKGVNAVTKDIPQSIRRQSAMAASAPELPQD